MSLPEQTFGSALRDALPLVSNHIAHGLQFMQEFREFVKERSAIERDYSKNLEALTRKHSVRIEKRMRDLSIGTLVPPSKEGNDESYSSTMKAWALLLIKTDSIAKERQQYSDRLLDEISDKIKIVVQKKEDARKKHLSFATKVVSDRDKLFVEKDKARSAYLEKCELVESARLRYDKRDDKADDKTHEKLKKAWHMSVMEMNNHKNSYLIALDTSNVVKKDFYNEELPWIMEELQDLEMRRLNALKSILSDYMRIDIDMHTNSCKLAESLKPSVNIIDPADDVNLFIKTNRREWVEPTDFNFEPTTLWRDTPDLVKDDYTKVVLQNQKVKVLQKKKSVLVELDSQNKALDGLTKMFNAYKNNARLGNYEEIKEQMVDILKHVVLLRSSLRRYDAQIATIEYTFGGIVTQQNSHSFQPSSFTLPSICGVCHTKIWSLTKGGLCCKDCGYNCHAKCELKVPLNCSPQQNLSPEALTPNADDRFSQFSPTKSDISEPVYAFSSDSNRQSTITGGSLSTLRESISIPAPVASPTTTDTLPSTTSILDFGSDLDASLGFGSLRMSELDISRDTTTTKTTLKLVKPKSIVDIKTKSVVDSKPKNVINAKTKKAIDTKPKNDVVDTKPKVTQITAKAMYDYTPVNADELEIRCGDEVIVIEGDDGSGWMMVLLGVQAGLVPVSYMQILDSVIVSAQPSDFDDIASQRHRVSALYSYEAQSDIEISVVEGQSLEITRSDLGVEGWCEVRTTDGKVGQVPVAYITL